MPGVNKKPTVSLKAKHKNPKGGLSSAGRRYYNAKTGANLKAPVSKKAAASSPTKAARRKSFCARMSGLKSKMASAKTKSNPNSRVNKALRKWDC